MTEPVFIENEDGTLEVQAFDLEHPENNEPLILDRGSTVNAGSTVINIPVLP